MPMTGAYHTRPMPAASETPVDALLLAGREAEVVRDYSLADLQRVQSAGALPGTNVSMRFRFGAAEGGVGVTTDLSGHAVLTCQRCLKPVEVPVSSQSDIVLVGVDVETGQMQGREPVVADPSHLDLRWLAEEEVLLALPLVPMHEAECVAMDVPSDIHEEQVAGATEERQRPFENLRDLLNRH